MGDEKPPQEPEDRDEELEALPPGPPPRRSPLLAAAVLLLSGLVLFHLRYDILYAFGSRTPTDLGDARALANLTDNVYAKVRGQPDRRNALFLEPRGERARLGFFRLLGAGSRMFVQSVDTTERPNLADAWTGRLRKMSALPYAPALRAYYAKDVQARRFVAPDTFKAALEKNDPALLQDRAGDALGARADTTLDVDIVHQDTLAVTLSRETYPSLADAVREVERLGIKVSGKGESQDAFNVFVHAPANEPSLRNTVMTKLAEKEMPVSLDEERLSARFSEIKLEGANILLPKPRLFAEVKSASIAEAVVIPEDAWVLIEDQAPGGYLWTLAIAGLLLAFIGFNVWYLARRRT
jgi:hypothetical protein